MIRVKYVVQQHDVQNKDKKNNYTYYLTTSLITNSTVQLHDIKWVTHSNSMNNILVCGNQKQLKVLTLVYR